MLPPSVLGPAPEPLPPAREAPLEPQLDDAGSASFPGSDGASSTDVPAADADADADAGEDDADNADLVPRLPAPPKLPDPPSAAEDRN
jgi:hypothetical protein